MTDALSSPRRVADQSGKSAQAPNDEVAKLIAQMRPVMQGIAAAVGPHCEVVLHDTSHGDLGHSIVEIVNGHVTGRKVGGPSTNLGFEQLRTPNAPQNRFGYRSIGPDGQELRSASVYLQGESGRVVACLCINIDMSVFGRAHDALGAIVAAMPKTDEPEEVFATDVSQVLSHLLREAVAAQGKPMDALTKAERLRVFRFLDDRGAFQVKKSVEMVAKELGVSRVTVYKDLDEIRK